MAGTCRAPGSTVLPEAVVKKSLEEAAAKAYGTAQPQRGDEALGRCRIANRISSQTAEKHLSALKR
ncbi:MAG: hypothetical protein ACU84Q_21005 [Gammaproteobacteria bacterium]